MSYDTKCHEIAEFFMSDEPDALQTPANIARIAQRVQDVIEDEIECINQDADDAREAAKDEAADREMDDRRFGKDRDEWRHEAAEAQRLK